MTLQKTRQAGEVGQALATWCAGQSDLIDKERILSDVTLQKAMDGGDEPNGKVEKERLAWPAALE